MGISRRRVIANAAAAAGAALTTAPAFGQGPSVITARRFRAWIGRGLGPGRTTLQDVRLRPISGRQVVVRTEACNLCYSNVGAVLGIQAAPATPPGAAAVGAPAAATTNQAAVGLAGVNANAMALMQGHGGVGVVEAVG